MWHCSQCGEENEDNFDACWNCQTEKSASPSSKTSNASKSAHSSASAVHSSHASQEQTYSKNEKVLATVGQQFLTSLLVGAGFLKTSLMVTDKRIYAAGTNYSSRGKAYQSLVGEVKSLHTIGVEYRSNFWLLIPGILLLPLFGAGLVFIGLYFWSRQRYIQLNFGGELTSLSLRGISNEEVARFIKIVMIVRE